MKLNLGSHAKTLKGYISVDALPLPEIDVVHNLTNFPYPWEDDSIEEIVMVEVLEHISWRDTVNVLKECYRILEPKGKIHIQVPDCGSMMEAYVNDKISIAIPHKGNEDYINQIQKDTRKLVHPNRWQFAFTGAQKHEFDSHLNVFTRDILDNNLRHAGFQKVVFKPDVLKWKIKLNAYK